MKRKFKEYKGMLWPAYDTQLLRFVHSTVDITNALKYVKSFNVAFQAGGACGLWAKELASHFNCVYTFEPDPLNFSCLNHNIRGFDHKIIRTQAALGEEHQLVGMTKGKRTDNAGAQHADPEAPGYIPMLKLDDFYSQERVGLIILDIEGWEAAAIRGAEKIIKTYRPVVMIEAKPLQHMPDLGTDENEAGNVLRSWGYIKKERIHRDDIFVYEESSQEN